LTPSNCRDLLFDDVIWVQEALKDHYDFTLKMQASGVEVLELNDVMAPTLDPPDARAFVLDRPLPAHLAAGYDRRDPPLARCDAGKTLADHLIRGIAISDLAESDIRKRLVGRSAAPISSCPRSPTRSSNAIHRAGSTEA
jgi:arginine deiminase